MAKLFAFLSFGLIILSGPIRAEPQNTPFIVAIPEGTQLVDFFRADLDEIYRRAGLQITLTLLPTARSIEIANDGTADAEAVRTAEAASHYANLRQVPEPLITLDFRAFTLGSALQGEGWRSLAGHHPCIVLGGKLVESRTAGLDREIAKSTSAALKMLRAGRCDMVIGDQFFWLYADGSEMGPFCQGAASLETVPLYHYVHFRHEDLVPALTQAIRDMHREGSDDKFLNPFMRQLDAAKSRNLCKGS